MVADKAAGGGGQKLTATVSANKPVNVSSKTAPKSNQNVTKTSNNGTPKDNPKDEHAKIETENKEKDENSPTSPPLPKTAGDDKCQNKNSSK